jgi:hypothetical protein
VPVVPVSVPEVTPIDESKLARSNDISPPSSPPPPPPSPPSPSSKQRGNKRKRGKTGQGDNKRGNKRRKRGKTGQGDNKKQNSKNNKAGNKQRRGKTGQGGDNEGRYEDTEDSGEFSERSNRGSDAGNGDDADNEGKYDYLEDTEDSGEYNERSDRGSDAGSGDDIEGTVDNDCAMDVSSSVEGSASEASDNSDVEEDPEPLTPPLGYDLHEPNSAPVVVTQLIVSDIRTTADLAMPLYDGATITLFHTIRAFTGLQTRSNVSQTAMMQMFAFVRAILPHPNTLCTYRQVLYIFAQVMNGREQRLEMCGNTRCHRAKFENPDIAVDPRRKRQFADCKRCPFCKTPRYLGQSDKQPRWAVPVLVILFFPLATCMADRMADPALAAMSRINISRLRRPPETTTWGSIHDSKGWEEHVLMDPRVIQERYTMILRGCGDGVNLFKDHTYSCDIFMDECLNPRAMSEWSGTDRTMLRLIYPGI